ncbi:G- coupled estrogen receptor 1-like [Brachionus plicatilis]|uniref:G-coupled estrogen receptor 1-like n=1 Tax=Brachionus plicatilis TaxID=10195 RepID=A0A3M7QFB0_BRAPC|nr:G- coupled estrogen receptor 1-like [Brachionus plicatilis]
MNQTNAGDDEYFNWAINMTKSIAFYIPVVVLPIGIVLNILEICIFQMKAFSKTSMGFYFTINCSVNILTFISFMIFAISGAIGFPLSLFSDWGCRFNLYTLGCLYISSSWLNVIIVVDRVLFVIMGQKLQFLKKKKNILIMLLTGLALIMLINSPSFWFYVQVVNSDSSEVQLCTADSTISLVRDIVVISMRTIVPFILMLIMEVILILKVRESRNKISKNRKMVKEFRFLITVVLTNIIFLILYTPNVGYIIWSNIYQNSSLSESITATASNFLFQVITSSLIQIYNSFDFLVQLACNNLFRKEVLKVIPLLKKIGQVSSIRIFTFGSSPETK